MARKEKERGDPRGAAGRPIEALPWRPDRKRLGRALAACFFGWLIPGAGHWYLGRRGRACLFLGVIALLLVLGIVLDGRIYRVEKDKPLTILATLASMGNGPAHFMLRGSRWTSEGRGDNRSPRYEFGNTLIIVAGLLNVLVILDAYDVGVGLKN